MSELRVRKNIRLENRDYSQPGRYFVTMCVKDGHEMLGTVVGAGFHARPSVDLTDLGAEVQKSIEYVRENDDGVKCAAQSMIRFGNVHTTTTLSATMPNTGILRDT